VGMVRGRTDQLTGIERQILAGIRCARCSTLRIGDEERCDGCNRWFDPRAPRGPSLSDDTNGRNMDGIFKRMLVCVALVVLHQSVGVTDWLARLFDNLFAR